MSGTKIKTHTKKPFSNPVHVTVKLHTSTEGWQKVFGQVFRADEFLLLDDDLAKYG
jgi:hypothetical protein